MRRFIQGFAVIALSIAAASCSSGGPSKDELTEQVDQLEADKEELTAKVAELTEQLDTAREKVAQVSSAAEDVQAAADRFNGKNWRSVVPDVQSASDDLETAKAEAADAVEEQ